MQRVKLLAVISISAFSSILLIHTQNESKKITLNGQIKVQENILNNATTVDSILKQTQINITPFVNSFADLDSVNCSFYLLLNSTSGYQTCLKHLQVLKDKASFSNTSSSIKKFSSCAVVGSGSSLVRSGHGLSITAADKIFRMNEAPTEGYEEDVGWRTDYRLMHFGMIDRVAKLFPNDTFHRIFSIHEGKVASYSAIGYSFHGDTDHIIHPQLLRNLSYMISPFNDSQYYESMMGKFTGKSVATGYCSPSTGIRGILIALILCEEVSAYGFSMEFNQNKDTWSYYRGDGLSCSGCWSNTTSTTNHCFLQERELMNKWKNESQELYGSYFKIVT